MVRKVVKGALAFVLALCISALIILGLVIINTREPSVVPKPELVEMYDAELRGMPCAVLVWRDGDGELRAEMHCDWTKWTGEVENERVGETQRPYYGYTRW